MTRIGNATDADKTSGTMASQLSGTQLSQEGFLKLLLAQLRMQSPTSPFDSSTMMQQISQLTGLSSSQSLEKSVKSLGENMGVSQILEASRLVGQQVQIPSEKAQLIDREGLKGAVIVPPGVDSIEVTIRDMNDKVVKTMTLGAPSDGVLDFSWDGLNASNQPMAAGYYKISANAVVSGQNTALPVAGNFKVNSVALDRNGNGVILNVDGLGGVSMKDIIKIL
jgi:flagellar basal-body rod modification protein FlgD